MTNVEIIFVKMQRIRFYLQLVGMDLVLAAWLHGYMPEKTCNSLPPALREGVGWHPAISAVLLSALCCSARQLAHKHSNAEANGRNGRYKPDTDAFWFFAATFKVLPIIILQYLVSGNIW